MSFEKVALCKGGRKKPLQKPKSYYDTNFGRRGETSPALLLPLPQNNITPGGVEGDGDHLLIPLDTVDGQLPLGGRGHHRRGVHHPEHDRRRQGAA